MENSEPKQPYKRQKPYHDSDGDRDYAEDARDPHNGKALCIVGDVGDWAHYDYNQGGKP